MALSVVGKVLLLTSLAVGLLACFWPAGDFHQHLPPVLRVALQSAGCPLGYGADSDAELPGNHPGLAKQGAATVVPGVKIQVLAVYYNGTIWTADTKLPAVDALLVDEDDGSVLLAGGLEEVTAHARSIEQKAVRRLVSVELRDLQGNFMMPGLIDPHVHLMAGGLSLSHVDLSAAASRQEVEASVQQAGQAQQQQGCKDQQSCWILGGGWNEQLWGGQLPHKSWLDEAVGAVAVFVTRMDLHCGLASSEALRLAGIGPETKDPPGGVIDRGPDGLPTGILRENAMQLVSNLTAELSVEQRMEALTRAADHALSRGITTVGDMGRLWGWTVAAWSDFDEIYLPLADKWQLPLRIHPYMPLHTWSRLATRVASDGYVHNSGRLFWGGVKGFADGSLGSCTALMHQPYHQCPSAAQGTPSSPPSDPSSPEAGEGSEPCSGGRCGLRQLELSDMERLVRASDEAGLQVAIHAIGDRVVDEVATLFHRAAAERQQRAIEGGKKFRRKGAPDTTPPSRPFRLEHVQHLSGPDAAALLAHPDIIAVTNPLHLLTDVGIAQARLGERAAAGRAFAYQTMAQAGVALASGSDWPVVGLEPLLGVHAAAHRRPTGTAACCSDAPSSSSCFFGTEGAGGDGAGVEGSVVAASSPWPWLPSEALDPELALMAHTWGAATALMMQDYVGALRKGMRADFVVLEHSPLRGPWSCQGPKILVTAIDGKCVHGCKGAPWAASATA